MADLVLTAECRYRAHDARLTTQGTGENNRDTRKKEKGKRNKEKGKRNKQQATSNKQPETRNYKKKLIKAQNQKDYG
jgi:hypothetical protein